MRRPSRGLLPQRTNPLYPVVRIVLLAVVSVLVFTAALAITVLVTTE